MSHSHHGHDHHHHHHPSPTQFNKAFALATILNLAFTLAEGGYAIVAHSMSLLADAGHNLGDVVGLVLAWGANYLLTKPATERYSYGYKRTSILAAIINSLLLVATCSIIAYESVNKLLHPTPVNEMIVMIIALIGIAINGSTALLFTKGHEDLNIKSTFLHLAYDALVSFGVVITGFIILKTQLYWLDPLVGIIIVVVILSGTWGLLRHSLDLLLDAVPPSVNKAKVEAYLMQIPGIDHIHDLHIWGLSTNEVALTAHLVFPEGGISDAQYAKINEDLLHDYHINHVTIQIERGSNEHPCSQQQSC